MASCLAGIGSLGAVTGAEAAPVALLDVKGEGEVAVAGDEVLAASETPRGGGALTAFPTDGGPTRRRLTVAPPRRGWEGTVRLASSAQRTAVLVAFEDDEGNPREWRIYSGPSAGPFALVERVRWAGRGTVWIPVDLDVDGDRLLISELRLPRLRFRATVVSPSAPPARVSLGRLGSPVALAGDHLAYVHLSRRRSFLEVLDWRTGERTRAITLRRITDDVDERDIDLATDGRVVAAIDGRLLVAGPGEPARVLPGSAGRDLSTPRFAGDLVVALASARFHAVRPVVIDSRTGSLRLAGPPSTALDVLAADERTVAWLANGCVLAARLDGSPLGTPPPGPCPRAEVVLEEGDQRLRGRRVRVAVTCVTAPPAGCRGVALLGRGGWAGRGRFRVPAGERRVIAVGLSPRGLSSTRRRLRRFGDAVFALDGRVVDGRLSHSAGTSGLLIDRVVRRRS
jgi:hypothetical protein